MAKGTQPDITRCELTIAQQNAIDLLVTGKTDREMTEGERVKAEPAAGGAQRP
jgi:hypothetical protein